MAVIAFTSYADMEACLRTNTYLCDGHGLPAAARSNRYIADGHGGTTRSLGYLCPSDPILATSYMEAIQRNYNRQHTINPNRKKGCVTHIQLYVSPTEEDHVPSAERLEMTRELIERTVLKDFPSIYIAHDNTAQGHCHISLCPFSEDGSHKLCMNNNLLYDLRRQMDYICVEHGYSIIECPELWGDRSYREWFFDVKEKGTVTIHPPKEQNKTFQNMEKKRARNYSRSKRAQTKKKEAREAYYRELTKGYSPGKDAYFFTSHWLYNPTDPTQPLRIKRITDDGKERNELELHAAAMGAWAYHCEQCLKSKSIPGTDKLQKRMHTIMGKTYAARQLMLDLDIRTQEELISHIKECGQDIGTLKRSIKNLEAELENLHPIMRSIGYLEAERNSEARLDLEKKGLLSTSEIEATKKKYTLLLARKENHLTLLEDRNKEYRYLKEAEKILNPASCKEAWDNYLTTLFSDNVIKKARWISSDQLESTIYELGTVLGIPEETLDQYFVEITETPEVIRSNNYQQFRKHITISKKIKGQAFTEYYTQMGMVTDLEALAEKLTGFGLLGVLIFAVVDLIAELRKAGAQVDLEMALWEAKREKEYADMYRRRYRDSSPYYSEVLETMREEKQKSTEQIQQFVSRLTIFDKVEQLEDETEKKRTTPSIEEVR